MLPCVWGWWLAWWAGFFALWRELLGEERKFPPWGPMFDVFGPSLHVWRGSLLLGEGNFLFVGANWAKAKPNSFVFGQICIEYICFLYQREKKAARREEREKKKKSFVCEATLGVAPR
jgi:hypothetical protein